MCEEVTGWYPGSILPYRYGIYIRAYKLEKTVVKLFSMFDERGWHLGATSVEAVVSNCLNPKDMLSSLQSQPWCGLAKDPNEDIPS